MDNINSIDLKIFTMYAQQMVHHSFSFALVQLKPSSLSGYSLRPRTMFHTLWPLNDSKLLPIMYDSRTQGYPTEYDLRYALSIDWPYIVQPLALGMIGIKQSFPQQLFHILSLVQEALSLLLIGYPFISSWLKEQLSKHSIVYGYAFGLTMVPKSLALGYSLRHLHLALPYIHPSGLWLNQLFIPYPLG